MKVTGLLNETIGSFTCTRACEAPIDYETVFTHDWDNTTGSEIGKIVKWVKNNTMILYSKRCLGCSKCAIGSSQLPTAQK